MRVDADDPCGGLERMTTWSSVLAGPVRGVRAAVPDPVYNSVRVESQSFSTDTSLGCFLRLLLAFPVYSPANMLGVTCISLYATLSLHHSSDVNTKKEERRLPPVPLLF